MSGFLPGTTIELKATAPNAAKDLLDSIFLSGGLVLSQVTKMTGLAPYEVQNWVKRGFLPPPERKKYTLRQLCRIININMLKNVLPMERICDMLSYINGDLDDDSDDIIDDSRLYFMFVKLASTKPSLRDPSEADASIEALLQDYVEPVPGAKERVAKVLKVMLTAWVAARLHESANKMVEAL